MSSDGTYYDRKDPIAYLNPLYKRAKEWFSGIAPQLREQWDMYLANDDYQKERERLGYAHLSFPTIHVAIEAAQSTVYKILQSEQNLFVYEPIDQRDIFAKIAAEHLTSGFANVRADMEYDGKIMDMILATSIFDMAHMKLEAETIEAAPGLGLELHPDDIGVPKTYPSWNMYAPGSVLFDGSWPTDAMIPARFQEEFVTYQQLKRDWPKQVGDWILKHERGIDDVELSAQTDQGLNDESIYRMYSKRAGVSAPTNQRRGFLLVQAFVNAIGPKGEVMPRVVWWLPHVVAEGASTGVHRFGYVLEESAPAFSSVPNPFRTCRARRLPFTTNGRGTSGLMIPFQRQFSAQIAHEMDMDQLLQSPPVLMYDGVWIGRENPQFSAHEFWTVTDPSGANRNLDQLVSPMQINMPNRGYLRDMNQQIQNLGELIAASVESTTGANTTDTNKTLGAFEGRQSGGLNRMMIQFVEHANNLIWMNRMHLRMMREAPGEFLYPPTATFSDTLGAPGILTEKHLAAAVRCRVPALSEYAGKESTKVLWRMVGDGLNQIPLFTGSPGLQMWYIERMIRAMGISEADVQEAMLEAKGGVDQANYAAMQGSMPAQIGGGGQGQPPPPPGMNAPAQAVAA